MLLFRPLARFLRPQTREVLMEESNVQPVRCPVTVCGDIHGQFVRPRLYPGLVSGGLLGNGG